MRLTQVAVVPIVAALLAGGAHHQGTHQRIAAYAGCYSVVLTPWSHAFPRGEDSAAFTPPSVIRLDTSHTQGGRRLSPGIPALPSRRLGPRWRLLGPDTLELVWHNGFYGVVLQLAGDTARLRGRAITSTDNSPESNVMPTAEAVAARVRCSGY
jgi:hypothetical protein